MNIASRIFAVLIFVIVGCSEKKDVRQLSESDKENIRVTATEIRKAITTNNAKRLLEFVSDAHGLSCTDTEYTHKEIQSFLKNKNSHFYISLFDNNRFAKRCGNDYLGEYPAISEKEFLQSANSTITIIPLENDWVEVVIESPIKSHYPRQWYLHRENQAWRISGSSFIIGSCSCG
jgi:hypothetical protein